MSEDYYKARISELERELAQASEEIKMLEARERNLQNIYDQEKLWELYQVYLNRVDNTEENNGSIVYAYLYQGKALEYAKKALKVWKERK